MDFFLLFSNSSLLLYRKATDFCILFLHPATLLNSLISSNTILVETLGFSIENIMSSVNSGSFTYSRLIWMPFISFPCLMAVAWTSNTMLNRSGKRGHFYSLNWYLGLCWRLWKSSGEDRCRLGQGTGGTGTFHWPMRGSCGFCIIPMHGSDGKASAHNAGDPGLIPGLGRSSGEGNGNPLQYSSMDGGAWGATVHGVAKSRTRLSDFTLLLDTTTMASSSQEEIPSLVISFHANVTQRSSSQVRRKSLWQLVKNEY